MWALPNNVDEALAKLLGQDQPNDLWATAAFDKKLYALAGNGEVYRIDRSNGTASLEFTTAPSYSDAAP